MKVLDETLWQEQCAELEADGKIGQEFRCYLERWVDQAEELVEAGLSPVEAVRLGMTRTETELGFAGLGFLGQMLVLMLTHWVHAEQLAAQLSPIELRLAQDTLAMKVAQLQADAAQQSTQGEPQ